MEFACSHCACFSSLWGTTEKKGVFQSMSDLLGHCYPTTETRLDQQTENAQHTKSTIKYLEAWLPSERRNHSRGETSRKFSVIVDKTKDVQKKEKILFVLRYSNNGEVHERFLEFGAWMLPTKELNSFLRKRGLEYRENLIDQGCDGAAVMCRPFSQRFISTL